MPAIRCIAPSGDHCGEGVVWHAGEQAVYWTDVNRFLIHRHDLATQSTRSWVFDEPVVALSLTDRDDTLLVALGSKLIVWRAIDDRRRDHGFVLEGAPRVRLNEGRADPRGVFWVGSMKNNVLPDGEAGPVGKGEGKLFRVAPEGSSVWESGVGISNTLCWSPDGRTMYFGDSLEATIWAYDVTATGIANKRVFFADRAPGGPDGSAMDAEGYLWNARFGGGCVVRIAPDGRIDRVIELPVRNPTTCTFGGPDLRTLFVTSASLAGRPGERLAGGLFAIDLEVRGQPENRVRL